MSGILKSWLSGAGSRLLWIDCDAYAHRVFANGSPDWLRDAARRAAALEQAAKVIPTQVLTIDATAPFMAAAGALDAGDAAAVTGMLAQEPPCDYLATLLDAVAHRLSGRMDIVLAVPSPRDLLVAAGAAPEVTPDFNELDDVGMALADLARAVSSKPVHGLLLTVAAPALFGEDEAEAAGALAAAVRHFGWSTAVATADPAWPPPEGFLHALDADLHLFSQVAADALAAEADRRIGGGLGDVFWSGTGPPPASAGLPLYGVMPAGLQPEQALARLAGLAAPAG